MSLGRKLHAQVVADSPDYDLARVEADADGEPQAVLGANLACVRAGGVTKMEGRVAGPLRVILMGDGRAEERHAAVPGELIDVALEAFDGVAEDAEEALHDLRPRLRVELFRELHRALHVGEENGDLLALALDRGFRLADLLAEERRMGWRWSRRPSADRQRRATAAAESLADLDWSAAGGTPCGQSGAALRAEAAVGPVVVVTGRTAHRVSGKLVVADRGATPRSHRRDVADLCHRLRNVFRRAATKR